MDNNIFFEAPEYFEVPVKVVDAYLNVPDVELRLILLLLRKHRTSFPKDELLEMLGVDEPRLEKAFAFWCHAGIICKVKNKYLLDRPKVSAADVIHYQPEDIAARMTESADIRFLLSTAERAYGRALTSTDASVILSLTDWVGLKPEVATMLLEYCGSGNKSMWKMQRLATEWAENGITTIELADQYIKEETDKDDTVNRVAKALGFTQRPLTDTEKKLFHKWSKEFGFGTSILAFAYDAVIKHAGQYSYRYMDVAITRWHEEGLTTLEEVKKAAAEFPKYVKGKKQPKGGKTKLDVDEAMKNSWTIITSTVDNDEE